VDASESPDRKFRERVEGGVREDQEETEGRQRRLGEKIQRILEKKIERWQENKAEEGGRFTHTKDILMQITSHTRNTSKEKICIFLHGDNGVSALY
jgi:hypothetical protein